MIFYRSACLLVLATLVSGEPPVRYNYRAPTYTPPSNTYLQPTPGYNAPQNSYLPPTFGSGYSNNQGYNEHQHHHDHEEPKAYEFGYSVKDAQSGNDYNRRETSDGNEVRGEYRVQLPDGRTQIVTYHADWQTGYHADVRYEGEARYPEPTYNNYQDGYNYNAPNSYTDTSGYHGNVNTYKPTTAYGPPGYHR